MKLTDVFTKLSYVFKTDLFIIDKKYVIGGSESNLKNVGTMMCELSDDSIEVIKEELPDSDMIYIKNVKDAKKNLDDNIVINILPTTKNNMLESLEDIIKMINKCKKWDNFKLTEEEYKDFFDKSITIQVCKDETLTPISIAKVLFPMLSEKNFENLLYNLKTDGEYTDNLITKFEIEYFTLYNILYFLNY